MNFHEHLARWETFYVLVGTAGATLAGLTFVAITASSRFASRENIIALRSHLDPSVVAFSLILVLSCVLLMPTLTPLVLGLLLVGGGLYLSGYTIFIARQLRLIVRRKKLAHDKPIRYDRFDQFFYGLLPLLAGFVLILCEWLVLLDRLEDSFTVLGITLLALLVMGIRNALDMLMLTLAQPAPNTAGQQE